MRIDVYLALYEDYRKSVINMAKMIDKIEARRNEAETLLTQNKNENLLLLEGMMSGDDSIRRTYEKKKRILGKATKRLKLAMLKMTNASEVEYLTYRYFYGMSNVFIADNMAFSERQIYRLSKSAKEHLAEKLLEEMPKVRKMKKCRYYVRSAVSRKRRYRKHAYGGKN